MIACNHREATFDRIDLLKSSASAGLVNVKLVVVVRCHFVLMGSDDGFAVLAHQSADTAVANI